jgi:hypothetical protein
VRLELFGLLMLLVMLFRPTGLISADFVRRVSGKMSAMFHGTKPLVAKDRAVRS